MKKIILMFFLLSSFMIFKMNVKAEEFYEGDFINGEYINKVVHGKTYYMTMQYIKDRKGNIVYCLEPFSFFSEDSKYNEYVGDLSGYANLSEEQKRKIELIIYYGYGYQNRKDSKWYVITQFMIWKVVSLDSNIYFTDTLNGQKINKYIKEIDEINKDIINHDEVPSFIKDYKVMYEDNLEILNFSDEYEIVNSDYEYKLDKNNLIISNLLESGEIIVRKKSNYYKNKVVIYDSIDSQDLIRPGNVINDELKFKIIVSKGDITLDIKNDDSVYTVESDFSNTCYEIKNDKKVVDSVCTGKEPLIYKTEALKYGEYIVIQRNHGIGYKEDTKIYKVVISEDNEHPYMILYNQLLKNRIEIVKYACLNQVCAYEKNAKFEVRDSLGNVVDYLKTNEKGESSIIVGYGSYFIKQIQGLEDYTLADDYKEKIVDEESPHKKELFNYKEDILKEEVVIPPKTSVDSNFSIDFLFERLLLIVKLLLSTI